jgi:uncharacterized membrane protein YfcA
MILALFAGVTQYAAFLSGEWATPVNTFLLIVLALITAWRTRRDSQRQQFIAKQVEDVREKLTDAPRPRFTRTRKGDPPPWQPPSE